MLEQHDRPGGFATPLGGLFPDEREGIAGLFDDMRGLSRDAQRLSGARGQADMSRFPLDFPHLCRFHNKTWGEMAGAAASAPCSTTTSTAATRPPGRTRST